MGRILKDIPALVTGLQEQKKRTRDLVAPGSRFTFAADDGQLLLRLIQDGQASAFPIQKQVHGQLGNRYGIHMRYYRTMEQRSAADLLATNLDYWRKHEDFKGDKRLLRLIGDLI